MNMSAPESETFPSWQAAVLAAALFAVDPHGTCGVALRALSGPVRERWLTLMRDLLPASAPMRRIPLNISDTRLLGGLDLAATLRTGKPMAERGLLTEAHGGVVVLAMAERLSPTFVARLVAVLDQGEVDIGREGISVKGEACIGVIALDEGMADDEQPPAALINRLAFRLDLSMIRHEAMAQELAAPLYDRDDIAQARARLPKVRVPAEILEVLCTTANELGIDSVRAILLALRAACSAAALAGHAEVDQDDVTLAVRLVLAPRARIAPPEQAPQQAQEQAQPQANESESDPANESPQEHSEPEQQADTNTNPDTARPLDDVVLEAARAAIPAGLLAQLKSGQPERRVRSSGKSGALQQSGLRGRPAGLRQGAPRAGARLNVIETLRAAAPWQLLRRRNLDAATADSQQSTPVPTKVIIHKEDFRVTRYRQHAETTTIFVVDASGSSALHRLAEAKGAVELLLADCYVRRDRVAVIAFRGNGAELLLPPTRSLVRAKRSLSSLPGGGGTPLAAGIDAAVNLADLVQRGGRTPTIVLLTDGRGNIARDGSPGRERAQDEAMLASRRMRRAEFKALLVDTSPRPQLAAEHIAREMGARYLPLPYADAQMLSRAVRSNVASIA